MTVRLCVCHWPKILSASVRLKFKFSELLNLRLEKLKNKKPDFQWSSARWKAASWRWGCVRMRVRFNSLLHRHRQLSNLKPSYGDIQRLTHCRSKTFPSTSDLLFLSLRLKALALLKSKYYNKNWHLSFQLAVRKASEVMQQCSHTHCRAPPSSWSHTVRKLFFVLYIKISSDPLAELE